METPLSIALITGTEGATVVARRDLLLALSRDPDARNKLNKLREFRATIERALRSVHERPTEAQLREFGEKAWAVLFGGDVLRLAGRIAAEPTAIELLLDSPETRDIPWEYMIEPDGPVGPRLGRPLVRLVPQTAQTGFDAVFLDEVELLFVAADPTDQSDRVAWKPVQRRLEKTFGEVGLKKSIRSVTNASIEDFKNALRNLRTPTILHFAGHGKVENGVGHLLLQDPNGMSQSLSAEAIVGLLKDRPIQLVILGACESSAGESHERFGSIARSLVEAGLPAVMAYSFPLPSQTIICQASALYESLLQDGDIDKAMSEARVSLYTELKPMAGAPFEWGLATLHRRPGVSKLFKPPRRARAGRRGGPVTYRDGPASMSEEKVFYRGARAADDRLHIGVWNLDDRIANLVLVLDHLNQHSTEFAFEEVSGSVPPGLISTPAHIREWARGRLYVDDVALDEIEENLIISDMLALAERLRVRHELDYVVIVAPSLLLVVRADAVDYNRIAAVDGKRVFVSSHDLESQARDVGRPVEAALAVLIVIELFIAHTPGLSWHERSRGDIFDYQEDRDMRQAYRTLMISDETWAEIGPHSNALQDLLDAIKTY